MTLIQSEHCEVTFVEKSKHNMSSAQFVMCTSSYSAILTLATSLSADKQHIELEK